MPDRPHIHSDLWVGLLGIVLFFGGVATLGALAWIIQRVVEHWGG